MKRIYIALALAGIIAFAVLADAGMGGMDVKDVRGKMGKLLRLKRHVREHMWNNALNQTREEGILEYVNGSYYINGIELYLGNEWFMNSIARSDYDGDGEYEYVWQELEGLVNTEVVINGVLKGDMLYVSHINGIWYRIPKQAEIEEIQGILEYVNGSYYINGTELMIKRGFSKSDIDRDGSLERMTEELNGLLGDEIKVDGIMHDGKMIVFHINNIWAR
ncbi:MAG TPA: hypothetical protein ENI52_01100 [Thermoplasmata archaeon]|nr:hypothetical protein [Thermoplasmata archaeon]